MRNQGGGCVFWVIASRLNWSELHPLLLNVKACLQQGPELSNLMLMLVPKSQGCSLLASCDLRGRNSTSDILPMFACRVMFKHFEQHSPNTVSSWKVEVENFLLVIYGYINICVQPEKQALLCAFLAQGFLPTLLKLWATLEQKHIKEINTDTSNLVFRTAVFPLTWILEKIKILYLRNFE